MPTNKSAKKRVKTDVGRTLGNKVRKSAIRTYEKKFHAKIAENDLEGANLMLSEVISCYDKAGKNHTFHQNRADRKKSRLTQVYNKAIQSQG